MFTNSRHLAEHGLRSSQTKCKPKGNTAPNDSNSDGGSGKGFMEEMAFQLGFDG